MGSHPLLIADTVWAIALSYSQGFKKLWPSVLFFSTVALSMVGLSLAMNEIPIGTAYAVWVGSGASLTVAYSMVFGGESVGVFKLIFISGIIVAVVGLKSLPE